MQQPRLASRYGIPDFTLKRKGLPAATLEPGVRVDRLCLGQPSWKTRHSLYCRLGP